MNNKSQKLEQIQEKEFEIDYEPFDPRVELEKLKKGNKETRADRLEKYKQELIKQKQGIAEIQVDLEKQIRENPELSRTELMKTVLSKASEYRLSENQLKLFRKTLDKYIERHQTVRRARKECPDDKELFEACFGKKPKGVVEVIEGPMTLYFRCHDLEDYAWIYQNKFSLPLEKQKLTFHDLEKADRTGGCLVRKSLLPSLNNAITVEKARFKPMTLSSQKTLEHEEQHAINSLFKEQKIRDFIDDLLANKETQGIIIKSFQREKSPKILLSYLRSERENLENMAKDEALALYKPEHFSIQAIQELLLKSHNEGGLYNYYETCKKELINRLKERLTPEIFKKNKESIEKILHKVFVNEYQQGIVKAIGAMEELERMGKSRKDK